MRRIAAVAIACICLSCALAQDVLSLGDFETATWQGLTRSTEQVRQGKYAGKWANISKDQAIRPASIPADWSAYDRLTFWMYSEKANGQQLTLVCNSENQADQEGWDYYYRHFRVDWEGWRFFDLRLGEDIQPTRKPAGWHQIDYLSINAGGWQHQPLPDTVLYVDDVKLVRDPAHAQVVHRQVTDEGGLRRVTFMVEIRTRSFTARDFGLSVERRPGPGAYSVGQLPARTQTLEPAHTVTIPVELIATAESLRQAEPLTRDEFVMKIQTGVEGMPDYEIPLGAAVPLPKREHPLLFATAETFRQAKERAGRYEWARAVLDKQIQNADGALKMDVSIPDEAGQWGHHYVCKKCGSGLRHDNGKHICKQCAAEYTGWPYDQVIIAGIHHRYWNAVYSLGLGYAFTGNEEYVTKAREILLGYAGKYKHWPIHNVRNQVSDSGGRIFAQTLDEASSIIHLAWGYDMMYNSPAWSEADRRLIEDEFLREVVNTIKRNNAGISNWQSWHNAGIAAVGFCLQDEDIASLAINGKSGLRFQLANSILPDGFWYEGTAAYHYYALDAIKWAAEAALSAGIDLYGNPAHKSLYDAPLLYTFPDMTFPAVNDSDVFSILGRHGLYELAYARFKDPIYLAVAQHGKRNSLEALLWGAEELPGADGVSLDSRDFAGLGAAVLRQGAGPDQVYVHFDYGPHGGGHGHPDKLTVILFALGKQLAPDPARLAYGAPLQGSWYCQTFAHNTVTVDQRSQTPTEGKLTLFGSEPGFAVAAAECGTAYPGVMLRRAVALADGYMVDVYEVESDEEHTYDWTWHNFGDLQPGLETVPRTEPLGASGGYQHVKDMREANTDGDWSADFMQENANVRVTMVGEPGTELYFGTGMANNPPAPCPLVVARRNGKSTTFVSVIEPYREAPTVTGLTAVPADDGAALEIHVQRGAGTDVLLLTRAGGAERRVGGVTTTARACLVRMTNEGTTQAYHIE